MRIFFFVFNFTLGISIFLLGLSMLGNALSSILGFRLRTFLTRFTSTKGCSLLAGLAVTGLVQSSSVVNATMVVLVDSGVLSIHQAVAVMLGANIGTTVTAQMIALPMAKLAIPMAFGGLILIFLAKRPVLGRAVFSLGAVFFGLDFTAAAAAPLLRWPPVERILLELTGTPPLAVFAGVVLTVLVQSSSAVTGLAVGLAGRNLLTLPAAVGIALGSNIGTVFTTLLASVGRSRGSKAAAYADFFFNLGGVLLILPLFSFFVRVTALLSVSPARQVAHAHTLFNCITALAALPLLNNLANLAWAWAGIRLRNKNR
ncbi:MAG: Na/Pi symporter [Bacillota bacterium]|jgi:phosphate:Na+ symporter|nr:Na/Pi symporter [Bacillota bacterium]NLJ03789.1 Na/Pi cotransporter family protein [Bacillota bacterium]